jgi:hypothetical protein
MFLHDILYGNRWRGQSAPFLFIFREESLGVAFDLFFREEGNLYGHLVVILSSASELAVIQPLAFSAFLISRPISRPTFLEVPLQHSRTVHKI